MTPMADRSSKKPGAKRSSALSAYRKRMRSKGNVRVEVQVGKDDAALIRAVAVALADPARGTALRTTLRRELESPPPGLKALLERAPLDGIELDRARSTGRPVDL